MEIEPNQTELLITVFNRASKLGLIGSKIDLKNTVQHSLAFLPHLDVQSRAYSNCADLGSGAGLPGLILAFLGPSEIDWILCDRSEKRVDFLSWAIKILHIDNAQTLHLSVDKVTDTFQGITARLLAPPPLVAEAATHLLRPNAKLVVSEPPQMGEFKNPNLDLKRWPSEPLQELGLKAKSKLENFNFVVLEKIGESSVGRRSWQKMTRAPLW